MSRCIGDKVRYSRFQAVKNININLCSYNGNVQRKYNFHFPFSQISVTLLSPDIMGLDIFHKLPYELK